jgi:two-component system cell cycle response regulator
MAQKKLLVADDSITIQKVIRLALSSEGYDIHAVSDAKEALEQLSLFRPDLILLDVSLPGKNAIEIKRIANETGEFKNARFILLSSAYESVDEAAANEVHFHGHLTKPFDPAQLRQVLQDIVKTIPDTSEGALPPLPIMSEKIENNFAGSKPQFPPTPPSFIASPNLPPLEDLPEIEPEIEMMPPPPAREQISSLWQNETPLPPNIPTEMPNDTDIKALTASTLRLSGLEDDQWSVSETSKRPLSEFASKDDQGPNLTQPFDEDVRDEQRKVMHSQIDFPGLPPMDEPEQAPILETTAPSFSEYEMDDLPPPPLPDNTHSRMSDVVPLTVSQMEEVMKTQMQETLEKMARKLLPELAERIIKEEINRLLSESVH